MNLQQRCGYSRSFRKFRDVYYMYFLFRKKSKGNGQKHLQNRFVKKPKTTVDDLNPHARRTINHTGYNVFVLKHVTARINLLRLNWAGVLRRRGRTKVSRLWSCWTRLEFGLVSRKNKPIIVCTRIMNIARIINIIIFHVLENECILNIIKGFWSRWKKKETQV